MMFTIYILSLEQNKWYVGKTTNPNYRLEQHYKGNGSEWTKKYRINQIELTYQSEDLFEEDRMTKEYMSRYGIENVRGGSYVTLELPLHTKILLEREIRMAKGLCLRCGSSEHYITMCSEKMTYTFELEQILCSSMEELDKLTLVQLKAYAKENGISITGLVRKEDILKKIHEALPEEEDLDEAQDEAQEDVPEECVTSEVFAETIGKLEQRIAALEKKLMEEHRTQRKLRLRNLRFNGNDVVRRNGKTKNMVVILDPASFSLDDLQKKNYGFPPAGDEDLPGDSVRDVRDDQDLLRALDKDLNEIESTIREHYDFKLPKEVFDGITPLTRFLELGIKDVVMVGNVLKMGENSVVLAPESKKAKLVMETIIVSFVYYGGEWLIGVDTKE